ncbi:MAG TPA: adenylate/guanylate cyclase domain-containing protein [Spirochaetia bacterium]|nr:adenylate/guanylate cyclase domain-containing protein [Spirochaetia bacterium]
MKIRTKFISIVVPLLVAGIVIGGISAASIARNAVTRVAVRFMGFKTDQLSQYLDGQWRILVENRLTTRQDMIQAAQAGAETYARSLLLSDTELVFALDQTGQVAMATGEVHLSEAEKATLLRTFIPGDRSLATVRIGGVERVASGFRFDPFGWTVFTTEIRSVFYRDVNRISWQTVILTAAACVAAVVLLFFFVRLLTGPLGRTAGAMKSIITSNDLSARVKVDFRDEIGEMSQTFNVMIGELEKAYERIKRYAFDAVVAQKKENKIRHIFQKYVPQELIDRFFANPDAMLVGENRTLSILFSDIRSFTTISEGLAPETLVSGLNRYFSIMVDIIMNRGGIIDKYIGDAIMAMFGAPVSHDNDALSSVLAGLEMVDSLDTFNEDQRRRNEPEFRIGVGINYGTVTVGNIGTERKMDYTVIGDMVNVASRLEGLTKRYHQQVVISQMLKDEVSDALPTRIIDSVAVKGRHGGIRIYAPHKELEATEARAFTVHNESMEMYYGRRFGEASRGFREVGRLLPGDFLAEMMLERCARLEAHPPSPDWDGVEIMETK